MGLPKTPGGGHWELDLPASDPAPSTAAELPLEIDRNEPPPPTPLPPMKPSRIPDLELGKEPSGSFAGLLFHGNVLEEEHAAPPPPTPASAELSWTPPPEPPPPAATPVPSKPPPTPLPDEALTTPSLRTVEEVMRSTPDPDALLFEVAPPPAEQEIAPPRPPSPPPPAHVMPTVQTGPLSPFVHVTPAPPPSVRATPAPGAPEPVAPYAQVFGAAPAIPEAHAPGHTPLVRPPLNPRTPMALPRPDPEMRRRLEQSWARSTSWPGMTEEQHRVALVRATLEVLGAAQKVDSLADGLVHALVHIQARVHGTGPWLQEALVTRLPREWLLPACTLLARWSRLVAEQEGPAGAPWLEAAARLTEAVLMTHGRALPAGSVDLFRALEEEGNALTRRMDPEVREWLRAGRYVRTGASDAQAATAALDSASAPIEYAAELESVERAVPLLVGGQRWEAVVPLVSALARHAAGDERFAGRARLAGSALDRIYVPRVLAPILQALAEGTGPSELLAQVLRAGGPRVVAAGAELMERTKSLPVRRLLTNLLAEHPAEARMHALTMLADVKIPPAGKRTAFELLGAAGQPEDTAIIVRDRDCPDEDVRCAVLWATTALIRERALGLVLRAVDDPSRVVQARAVNLLGQLHVPDRNVLDRLARILEDESPEEDAETVVTTALWALANLGNLPLPGRGASVEKLLVTIASRPRSAGLRRVLGGKTSNLWWHPPVRVALCRALSMLGTDRARAMLRTIGEDVDDPGRAEARSLLARAGR